MSAPAPQAVEFSEVSAAKLASSGLDVEYARKMRVESIADVTELPEGISGPTPGMLFWHRPVGGQQEVPQYRPDNPATGKDGRALKYLFPHDEYVNLSLVRKATNGRKPTRAIIVEGTLQSLMAARYAADDTAVFFIPGCWGWSHNKVPTSALQVLAGLQVVVVLDADAGTNPDVYAAGERLRDGLVGIGATGPNGDQPVTFSYLPGGGSTGLDDYLASLTESNRGAALERLLTAKELTGTKPARNKPPGKPSTTDAEGLDFDGDDSTLAELWVVEHGLSGFRFNTSAEKWHAMHRGRWEQVGASEAEATVKAMLDPIGAAWITTGRDKESPNPDLVDAGKVLRSTAKVKSVSGAARLVSQLHIRTRDFDLPEKVGDFWVADNGVIDLRTGEFGPHDPNLMVSVGSAVAYSADARCPRFDAFLAEVLPDDEVRAFVMRLFGVAMFGRVPGNAHVIPAFVGEGRNGKGALIRIMEALFGSYSVKVAASAILERQFEKHEEEVAKLFGKRLATFEETTVGARWNAGRVKDWTGGDRLTGRFMRENSFDFAPAHLLIGASNHRPNVDQSEDAFWMRYREVPFEVSVEGREDPTLEPDILRDELPGVLNRVLEGLAEYRRIGLAAPDKVMVAGLSARIETDPLYAFADSGVIRVTGSRNDFMSNQRMNELLADFLRSLGTKESEVLAAMRRNRTPIAKALTKVGRAEVTCSEHNDKYRHPGEKSASRRWYGVVEVEQEQQSDGAPGKLVSLDDHRRATGQQSAEPTVGPDATEAARLAAVATCGLCHRSQTAKEPRPTCGTHSPRVWDAEHRRGGTGGTS